METTQNEHLDWNFPQQFYNQLELLFTRPNIQIPDQYIRKQDGVHLSSIQMVFKYWTIWHPTSFQHLNTNLVSIFKSPLCIKIIPLNLLQVKRRKEGLKRAKRWKFQGLSLHQIFVQIICFQLGNYIHSSIGLGFMKLEPQLAQRALTS